MKQHQNLHQAKSAMPQSLPVRFEVTHASAVSVYVAGTFNNGQPDAKPVCAVGNHRWVRETELPIGTYSIASWWRAKFVPILGAGNSADAFRERNSILKVASSLITGHLAEVFYR